MLTLPPFSLFFKAIYLHNSSELEIIRQQTHALFIDTLSERNIKKVTQMKFLIWSDIVYWTSLDQDQLGLTAHDMETRMALLHEERKVVMKW